MNFSSLQKFVTLLALLGLVPTTVHAQDPVEVAPQQFRVLFENTSVRILEVSVQSGEKVPRHSHPSGFAYALSSFKGKTVLPDSTSFIGEYEAGQFVETQAVTHVEENVGETLAHLLLIEFKTEATSPKRGK